MSTSVALISRERAQRNLNQTTFTADEMAQIDSAIMAASTAAERYCRRKFHAQEHDELHDGSDGPVLQLKHYPVLSVQRVSAGYVTVLEVTNTSSSNQRATVQVTESGLTLWRIASGTQAIDTSVTWSSYTTLSSVVTAIDALGNGWSASLPDSTYSSWASSDLRPIQGALNARNVRAQIGLHVEDLSDFSVDPERGWLIKDAYEYGLDDLSEACIWTRERNRYRVIYSAGYESVPEDVQEAIAQWVATLYWQMKDNPASYPSTPPDSAAFLLEAYKAIRL